MKKDQTRGKVVTDAIKIEQKCIFISGNLCCKNPGAATKKGHTAMEIQVPERL